MQPESSSSIPAGWYPDPAGTPQWRVWNGHEWSQLTKPFNLNPPISPVVAVAGTTRALRQLRAVGIPAFFVGLALLLGTIAHWPGQALATSTNWAVTAGFTGCGLLALGTIQFGYVVRLLQGHWSVDAFIPGLNVLSVSILLARMLRVQSVGSPPVLEALTLVLAGLALHEPLVVTLLLATMARTALVRTGFVIRLLEARPVS